MTLNKGSSLTGTAYLIIEGLLAGAAAGRDQLRPLAVISAGRVIDVCAAAAQGGAVAGMTLRYARRACPSLQAVNIEDIPSDLVESRLEGLYRAAYHLSPRVEPAPPSALYFTLKKCPPADLAMLARAIIPRVGHRLRLGIASNRLLARVAARGPAVRWGPSGDRGGRRFSLGAAGEAFLIFPGSEGSFLAPLPVGALWPLSRETRQRLRDLGLNTAGDVAAAGAARLQRVLGAEGLKAARLAAGIDHTPVAAAYPPPGVERSVNLPPEFDDGGALVSIVTEMAGEVGAELERGFQTAGRVVITFAPEEAGRPPWSRSRNLNNSGTLGPSTREAVIGTARSLAKAAANDRHFLKGGVASIHLAARRLRPAARIQMELWSAGSAETSHSPGSSGSFVGSGSGGSGRPAGDAGAGMGRGTGVTRSTAPERAAAVGGARGAGKFAGKSPDLSRLVKGLRRRFPPSVIGLGWESPDAYREQMLSYWDPLRMG